MHRFVSLQPRRGTRTGVKTMFATYAVLIALGIVVYAVVGVTHH
jgi:hypothetical protein